MRNPLSLVLTALMTGSVAVAQPVDVQPTVESTPGTTAFSGAIQDVALSVASDDDGVSLLITAYGNAGLITYGTDGQPIESELADGPTWAVAVRDGFPLDGVNRTLAVTANSNFNGLAAYVVDDRADDKLTRLGFGFVTGAQFSSVALYRSPRTGAFHVFAATDAGTINQYTLDGGDGGVGATLVRTLSVTRGVNGLAVDDEASALFVIERGTAIWRYGAEPDDTTERVQVVELGGTAPLSANVNRLGLYRAGAANGYLMAADTTEGTFAVIDRRSLSFVGTFRLVATDGGIDGITANGARGLAVTSLPVGEAFPQGLFVGVDSDNGDGVGNLKLAPWPAVADAFAPPLIGGTQQSDGGADGGSSDGGRDGGGPSPGQPSGGGQSPIDDDSSGCTCGAVSVPGSVLLGLLTLGLAGRRRRRD